MDRIRNLFYIFLFLFILVTGLSGEGLDTKKVLERVDEYRNFSDKGFVFDFTVKEIGETEKEESVMQVAIRGSSKALCKFISPQKNVGQYILMLDASFWEYVKGMNAPIRISKRQMLIGQVSTGDITRIVFSDLYAVASYEESGETYVLKLDAVPKKEATYDKMTLTVDKKSFKPVAAECFSKTGILLKTVKYTGFEKLNGREILTGFEIVNELNKVKNIVTLSNYKNEETPAQYFNKNYMKHLRW